MVQTHVLGKILFLLVACWWLSIHGKNLDQSITVVWKEETPVETERKHALKPKRQFLNPNPFRRQRREDPSVMNNVEPHKLRTDKWKLELRWRGSYKTIHNSSMQFEFADNGYVRRMTVDNGSPNQCGVGKWACSSRGVFWSLSIGNTSELLFHGQLLLNPFGHQPRLIRGVIVDHSRRLPWFRPVVSIDKSTEN